MRKVSMERNSCNFEIKFKTRNQNCDKVTNVRYKFTIMKIKSRLREIFALLWEL